MPRAAHGGSDRETRGDLTVDVGNSNISIAYFRGGRMVQWAVVERGGDDRVDAERVRRAARKILLARGRTWRGVAMSSVVPALTAPIERAVAADAPCPMYIFPRDFRGLLRVRPRPSRRVGADRLAAALGALSIERRDWIVVDVGTAATVDVVTRAAVFEGGAIAPGPRVVAAALRDRTAQLPLAAMRPRRSCIGRSTQSALEAGLWFGCRAMVQGLAAQALRERPHARVIVAGGDGENCMRGGYVPYVACPNLTHRGLAYALALRGTTP